MRTLTPIKIFISLLIISLILGTNLAIADSSEHGYYKNQHREDDDDDRNEKSRRYDDDDDHYEDRRYSNSRYPRPPRKNSGTLRCNPNSSSHSGISTLIGGILGGILGSNIGKGKGKTLATIAGVIVGATIGNTVGESMDERDRYCAGQALGNAQDNQAVAWTNPDTNQQYTVTPQRSYQKNNGRQCRDYTSSVIIDGRKEQATGTACKDYSGNWQIIN